MCWFEQSPSMDAGVPQAGGVSRDATSPVVACSCASWVRITGCRAVGVNKTIRLQAETDCSGGTFHWSSSSTRVTLTNADSSNVHILGGAQPSTGRDAETITVQWTGYDCSPISASINITVVCVVFSESAAQTYGYDDMDTPPDHTDDHVSVKKLAATVVHVVVTGGLNGDELRFAASDAAKATVDPAPAQAAFDLTIHGLDQNKAETNLVASVVCHDAVEITRMYINVYREKVVRAVVAKVYDNRHAGTTLSYPNLNIASAQTLINPKAKAAVVRYEISDHSATGGAIHIPYDLNGDGKLTWDIVANGGQEFTKIQSDFHSSDQRIVVVHAMVSRYYLSADAPINATTITLRGITTNNFLVAGNSYPLGTGGNLETVVVQSASQNSATVTLRSPLGCAHVAGEPLEFPAAGWGGNPIVIIEGASEEVIKWTFFHETGHAVLNHLADLEAPANIMHYSQGWTDHRLRMKPQNRKYSPPGGTEIQWELIPRT
jgi:hypothetical protein